MTKANEVQLPTNEKFGWFFAAFFLCMSLFCFYKTFLFVAFILGVLSLTFGFLAFLSPDLLLPLNTLWMRFGLALGTIINPIVMGIIFFLLVTPMALVLRLFGRDELNIKTRHQKTYWITRQEKETSAKSFLNQY